MMAKADFSADITAALTADIIGKEVILQSDLQLSESLSVNSLYGLLRWAHNLFLNQNNIGE